MADDSGLYRRILGGEFAELHAAVQCAHADELTAQGLASVRNSIGVPWLLARALRLPHSGERIPLRLHIWRAEDAVMWERLFDGEGVVTRQVAAGDHMDEISGPGRLRFTMTNRDGALEYRSVRSWLFGIPLPAWLGLRVTALVEGAGAGWRVKVDIRQPIMGLICAYEAKMEME